MDVMSDSFKTVSSIETRPVKKDGGRACNLMDDLARRAILVIPSRAVVAEAVRIDPFAGLPAPGLQRADDQPSRCKGRAS